MCMCDASERAGNVLLRSNHRNTTMELRALTVYLHVLGREALARPTHNKKTPARRQRATTTVRLSSAPAEVSLVPGFFGTEWPEAVFKIFMCLFTVPLIIHLSVSVPHDLVYMKTIPTKAYAAKALKVGA